MSRTTFHIPLREHRFPAARTPNQILIGACLRCKGTLVWDILVREWTCVNCGWLEWESYKTDANRHSIGGASR